MNNILILSKDGKTVEGVNRDDITTVTIPDGVTEIKLGAFKNCTSLQTVNIPESVTNIGIDAFFYCESLQSVTIPNGKTRIEIYRYFGFRRMLFAANSQHP